MIRIRINLYKISFGIILLLLPAAGYGQLVLGAKGLGIGQAATALPGYEWALFANPALLNDQELRVGFYGLRNYGFAEITDLAAFASNPAGEGVVALGFHRYGDHIFHETRVRAGYKYQWRNLHAGLAANYNHISFGADYGSGGALGLDAGIAAELNSGLWLGARAVNVNTPQYKGINEDLPRELAVGFSYNLNEVAVFLLDVVKDVRFPVSYRGGMDIKVIDQLRGRVGVTTQPQTYSLGFGYGAGKWEVNIAVQKHSVLDFSQGMDIMIYF